MMGSLRRVLNRKRRCVLVSLLIGFVFVSLSWLMNHDPVHAPVVKDNFTRIDRRIPPKFNVLVEPPKPPQSSQLSKVDSEKAMLDTDTKIKLNTNSSTIRNAMIVRHATISVQDKNKDKEVIVIKPEDKQSANESVKIEIAKNKTLAQMGVLGIKQAGNLSKKVIFVKEKWNLTVSFEDIGNVMKDTSFFNNLKPLDVRGPFLTSTKNRTANFSLSLPIKMGYCDCWELYCFCCVQLVNKQLHLNAKSCANFTFISKSHELDLTFSLNGNKIHKEVISADAPPLLCMGSVPKVADMCVHFSNMTYKVDRLGMHKSHLMGCADFSFNIYNKTVNVFPVDCFQIPGDPNHHPKHEQIILPNFVP